MSSKSSRAGWEEHLNRPRALASEGWPKLSKSEKRMVGRASRARGLDAEAQIREVLPEWAEQDLILFRCGPPSTPTGKGLARVLPYDKGPADLLGRLGAVPVAIEVKSTKANTWAPSRLPAHERDCLWAIRGEGQGVAGLLIQLRAGTSLEGWIFRPIDGAASREEDRGLLSLAELPQVLRECYRVRFIPIPTGVPHAES